MPKLEAWGMTDVGLVRQNNEDNWLIDNALSIAVVADGMGGAAHGEVASATTIEALCSYLRNPLEELTPEQLLKEAVREANRKVRDQARSNPNFEGMASTVVVARWDLPEVVVANVGDSRAYLWRGGQLAQLSYDQTLANELRRTLGLTEEQVNSYTHKHVLTMAVGASDDVLMHTRRHLLEPGDEILLSSDGLHGFVGDQAIARVLAEGGPLERVVQDLVTQAKQAGGEDNITAVLLRYKDG